MSKIVGSIVVGLIVIGTLAWWFGFRGESIETVEVQRGSIDVTIQTIGRVQSTGSTTVRAQAPGEIDVVAIGAGDFVVAGDILIQLDTEPLARARDAATRTLEDAEFALQLAQRQASENPDDENLTLAVLQAGQRVESAVRALNDAEEALRNAVILAPRDAVVLETLVAAGDIISRTQPVIVLYAREDLEVVANVDELDLVNVKPGADATVRLDAYPAQEIEGAVVATAPLAREQGGATIFPTTISINIPEELDIRPGMNADVTIVTEARDEALLVPQHAIRTVGERAFVTVIHNGERSEREVLLGYRSGGQVEVVSGLDEGDRVTLQ
ncbi:MAG: efflux RND transporter periplasmic adaptor subunit [Chloroflexia bacterium]|nr:efflux RND transporter periplasmic adaptor subunit [Chloroflexia bacterium]